MREEDKLHFAEVMTGAMSAYEKDCSKPKMRIFFQVLKKWDVDVVEAAFIAHIEDDERGKFVPKPADIIHQIRHITGESGDNMTADEAWVLVSDAASKHGSYANPEFGNGAIHYAIQACGGWVALCQDDVRWVAKRFKDSFHGSSHLQNVSNYPALGGQTDDPPVFCGRRKDELKRIARQPDHEGHQKIMAMIEDIKKPLKEKALEEQHA